MKQADPYLATRRYVDVYGKTHIKLLPKEYYVTDEHIVLTTVLGSCVAVCLQDTNTGVAGMNHFMLPDYDGEIREAASPMTYGRYATERLKDALIALGARPARLVAKVFGGANVITDMRLTRIGEMNAEFVRDYLAHARIPIMAEDLGGTWPRQLHYDAATGVAHVRRLVGYDAPVFEPACQLVDGIVRPIIEVRP